MVERGVDEAAPEAIVVLSNADDRVISTSGADDRFEVVPQVFVDADGAALSNQDAGRDVIVDLARRDDGSDSGGVRWFCYCGGDFWYRGIRSIWMP